MADQTEQLNSTGAQGTSAPPDDIPRATEEHARIWRAMEKDC